MIVKIKKNWPGLTLVWPGGPGTELPCRVDRVSPGQFPSGFLPQPGQVPGPGRHGPGLTRQAGSGFKTLYKTQYHYSLQAPEHLPKKFNYSTNSAKKTKAATKYHVDLVYNWSVWLKILYSYKIFWI